MFTEQGKMYYSETRLLKRQLFASGTTLKRKYCHFLHVYTPRGGMWIIAKTRQALDEYFITGCNGVVILTTYGAVKIGSKLWYFRFGAIDHCNSFEDRAPVDLIRFSMDCNNLTKWQGASVVVPMVTTKATSPIVQHALQISTHLRLRQW